jgi:Arylsulfotransferase (ASST)
VKLRGLLIRATLFVFAGLSVSSCVGDFAAPTGPRDAPRIRSTGVASNPYNVLSATVHFTSTNADSARVLYRVVSGIISGSNPPEATPFYPVRSDSGTIVALGLRPNTPYELFVQVMGAGTDTSAASGFQTTSVPAPLAALQLAMTGAPTSGYTLTDFTSPGAAYIVAFDSGGAICWYREFSAQPGENALDAEQRVNGNYTLFVGASTGWQPADGRFHEVNPAGDSIRSYAATQPYYTDPHELLLDYSSGELSDVHILGYTFRHMDLTAIGGRSDQLVAGHVILRQSVSGAIKFMWNAWDHLSIADWIFVPPGLAQMPTIDFDHPNSLVRDERGNYVVSFASLGEISKIDGGTGEFLWRFGGRNNQFTLVDDPLAGFGIQHDVRLLANGDLLFIDNGTGHVPQETRAVEYRLDVATHTATLVWEYRHSPPVFAPFAGSAQRLANGNTFVGFGADSRVVEVAPNGDVLWDALLTDNGRRVPFFYRATRLASLYRFEPR